MFLGLEMCQASRRAQWVEAPTYETKVMSLIPGPTGWKKEADSRFSSDLPMYTNEREIDR